jgi:hypothetical protein
MNITDEMVCMACAKFDSLANESQLVAMKAAIEAAIQDAWVKFDINDSATYPPMGEDVLVDFNGHFEVAYLRDSYGLCWSTGDIRFVNTAKRWMPLPNYKGA